MRWRRVTRMNKEKRRRVVMVWKRIR
jgi:hypothetical protein